MSNNLVQVGEQQAELVHIPDISQFAGMSGLKQVAKVKPTQIVLVQNTTKVPKGIAPGQLWDKGVNKGFDELTIIPLRLSKPRTCFPPGPFTPGSKPLCRSNDGLVPATSVEQPFATKCSSCHKSKWKKVAGKNIKPDCKEKVLILGVIAETLFPCYIDFGGMSFRPATDLLDSIERVTLETKALKGIDVMPHDFKFTVFLEHVDTKSGPSKVARFKDVTLDMKNIGKYNQLFLDMIVTPLLEAQQEGTESYIDEVVQESFETDEPVAA